jgi:hypothetical protein
MHVDVVMTLIHRFTTETTKKELESSDFCGQGLRLNPIPTVKFHTLCLISCTVLIPVSLCYRNKV